MNYNYPDIIKRADDRIRGAELEIARLNNEIELLRQISQAAVMEFPEALDDQFKMYRQLYTKKP